MTVRGVPCTTAARSLADFAAEATDTELATAVHVATTRTLCTAGQLEVQFRRRIAGIGRLRRLVEPVGPDLRGALEEAFAAFVRRGGWPPYEANVLLQTPLGPLRGDAVWRRYGFGVELDSWPQQYLRARWRPTTPSGIETTSQDPEGRPRDRGRPRGLTSHEVDRGGRAAR